ncbi:hypothetical protein [Dickeya phage Amaethon]|nr:hypothetical protein [Dickeya phage Amaethon]
MSAAKLRDYLVKHNLYRVCLATVHTATLLADVHTVIVTDTGLQVDNIFCPFGQYILVDVAGNISVSENLLK